MIVVVDDEVVFAVVAAVAERRIEGDGSRPLILREGRARVRVWRMYCCCEDRAGRSVT